MPLALFLLNIYAIYACARMLNYEFAKTVTIVQAAAFVKLTAVSCLSVPAVQREKLRGF